MGKQKIIVQNGSIWATFHETTTQENVYYGWYVNNGSPHGHISFVSGAKIFERPLKNLDFSSLKITENGKKKLKLKKGEAFDNLDYHNL